MFITDVKLIKIALIFIAFDVITGTSAAWKHAQLSSKVAREGLFHKFAFIIIIAFAMFLEYAQAQVPEIGLSVPTVTAVCAMIYLIEIQSVVENIAKLLPDDTALKIISIFKLHNEKFEYLNMDLLETKDDADSIH